MASYLTSSLMWAAIGPDWLITWLTPVWIISVGATAGMLVLLLLWALLWLINRRAAARVPEMVGEGALLPIFLTAAAFAIFGILGVVVVREPLEIMQSIPRFLETGNYAQTIDVEVTPVDEFDEILLPPFIGTELSVFRIESDQPIFISRKTEDLSIDRMIEIEPGNPYEWRRGPESISPFGDDEISELSISNLGETAGKVSLVWETRPVFPQSAAAVISAVAVIVIFLKYFIQMWLFPKTFAIAYATAKSEMAQPLFAITLALGAFMLFLFVFIPYNTFGEDIKMLKDSGFTTIMVLCIIQAVWGASNSVAEEIDGKTALTVLSKPVGRRQFILGKFAGISWTVTASFIVLGSFFLVLVAYKPVYDARESSQMPPIWDECHLEMIRTVPGLVLALMETLVLTALSVAISTRLPMIANFAICFAVYALGHLTPLIVQSSAGDLAPVAFMGTLIATALPMLEVFNIQAAIAGGRGVPYMYLVYSLVYCVLYSGVAMLLALILFEDRDLA